ncbi:MAG: septum formation initiator family protein [Oscillospiraceae bacterium]|jgi:cell division protein FtsB|nr:septum formation initiator family protein [Oscillospiraceae bacterium]
MIIILALTLYAGISLYRFWGHHVEVLESLQEARREAAELQQKIADLEYMLENINDPDVMRRIAEEVLGLVSPDELVIIDGAGFQTGN